MAINKSDRRQRIRYRVRKVVSGTAQQPRLAVYRSNKDIYVQLINDVTGTTICSASSTEKELKTVKGTKTEIANAVGKKVAERAISAGVAEISFDRGGYLYHGRVKALAEGAREAGLKF